MNIYEAVIYYRRTLWRFLLPGDGVGEVFFFTFGKGMVDFFLGRKFNNFIQLTIVYVK